MSTIKNKTLEINRVPLSRMLKSEMADYAERATAIVSNYDHGSDLINDVHKLLENQAPKIELLRISYGIDTQRLRVNSLKAKMMLKISALKVKVGIIKKDNLKLDMHVIENAIDNHLRHLNSKNDKELTQKIAGFFDLLDKNEEVFTQFSEFDLLQEVDTIKIAFSDMNFAYKKRVNLLSKRSKEPTREIMKNLHDAVNSLFKTIEVSHLVGYPTGLEEGDAASDFTDLINELSQLSDMYKRSIAIRLANNQRKLDKEKESEKGEEETEGTEDSEPMATAMRYGFDEDLDEFADEGIASVDETDEEMGDDEEHYE